MFRTTYQNFSNYWSGSRGGPSLAFKNWFDDGVGNVYTQDLTVNMINCLVYGNALDEFIIDSLANSPALFDVNLDYCLLKKEEIYEYSYLTNIIWNQNPMFIDVELKDFHVELGSPVIDSGNTLNGTTLSIDGVSRGGTPDIGAYEF